ncbi:hypothetical protein GGTG_07718 [Gaeumannomyces tritici R3-111a-1]|uniref:Uncharacterized protein n=1 Tax=Gaeumannomyces tritici (strain R3-111a-1) TaxID=644352 RepID=J3P2H1_GAET3|nr:hypothetical protein GGTG_07718 [Gaeumannomyces tritici R3-111a-1]EJT73863.1 hypothetical protein GGTG_07718 [Gaeumannomyces tritici R3-111a-1]
MGVAPVRPATELNALSHGVPAWTLTALCGSDGDTICWLAPRLDLFHIGGVLDIVCHPGTWLTTGYTGWGSISLGTRYKRVNADLAGASFPGEWIHSNYATRRASVAFLEQGRIFATLRWDAGHCSRDATPTRSYACKQFRIVP